MNGILRFEVFLLALAGALLTLVVLNANGTIDGDIIAAVKEYFSTD
jgi:hypothetical protein